MILKRLLFPLLLLLFLGGVGYGVYKTGALSPDTDAVKPTPTDKAAYHDVEEAVLTVGQIAPIDETDIKSEVSGMVMSLNVVAGQRVTKGQELLKLDQRELLSEKKEDEYQIIADKLKTKQAKAELDRDKDLLAKGFLPQKDYDDAEVAYGLAQNDEDIQQAKINTLEQEIIKTDLIAPHDGIVLKLDVREGDEIVGTSSAGAATELMKVADLSKLEVTTTFSEVDVVKVHVGDAVKLTFDAIPDLETSGELTYLSPSAEADDNSSTSSSGSKSGSSNSTSGAKTFDAIVTLDKIDPRIRPGITAHVTIPLKKAAHVLTIPVTGVFTENTDSVAFVKTGDTTYDKRPLSLGLTDGAVIEVKSGLKEGDVIATERPPGEEPPPAKPNGRRW
jgi:RND family efflux transporter MFP subunit